eukprot:Filipodium_phascolosomae@DN4954_c0_g1_i1.p1
MGLWRQKEEIFYPFLMLWILIYWASVLGWVIFHDTCPPAPNFCQNNRYFLNLPEALLSQFQMITHDNWGQLMWRSIQQKYPYGWLYWVPTQLLVSFVAMDGLKATFVKVITQSFKWQQEEIQNWLSQKRGDVDQPAYRSRRASTSLGRTLSGDVPTPALLQVPETSDNHRSRLSSDSSISSKSMVVVEGVFAHLDGSAIGVEAQLQTLLQTLQKSTLHSNGSLRVAYRPLHDKQTPQPQPAVGTAAVTSSTGSSGGSSSGLGLLQARAVARPPLGGPDSGGEDTDLGV